MPATQAERMGTATALTASTSACMHPILACLNIAEMEGDDRYSLGPNRIWHGVTTMQERFLSDALKHRAETGMLSEAELRCIASDQVQHLNAFLRDQGFPDVQLQMLPGPHDFGTAAVLKVGAKWTVPGTTDQLRTKWGDFPAARLKRGVSFYRDSNSHPDPVASIACENGDVFYITKLGDALDGLDLINRARTILSGLVPKHDFDDLVFPMVDYSSMVDISWLLGLWTNDKDGRRAVLNQAVQQTRFKMNHLGARTESAVAISVSRMCMSKPTMVVNEPFLVVQTRPGMKLPILAIRCTLDCWKDPGAF